jgi:hypothetical protein
MDEDKSPSTGTMQKNFTDVGNLITKNIDIKTDLQLQLNADLLNNDGNNVFNTNTKGNSSPPSIANPTNLWYANDLVYSTLLGKPYYLQDPRLNQGQPPVTKIDSPYNYIKNASGLNIYHQIPGTNWRGSVGAVGRYQAYYNTVTAVESFNSYVLSQQYADGNLFNDYQKQLIAQATSSTDPSKDWFAQIASENIGYVLRQILMYESQTFVLLTQMLQLQKQAVTAQAMTNTLLIAVNQSNENLMVSNAKGQQPSM